MASKEALNNIQYMLKRTNNLVFYKEEIEAIEKDLEILEIIKQKAKGNRFFKGCLLRMFQEDGEKKTYLDNPPRKIEKNYYKIKEWLEND